MAVCHCDVAGNCRGRKWARYPNVCIRSGGERIVSRKEHALGFHLQIESRFRQFEKRNSACHGEWTAGQIASHFDVSRPAVSQHLRILKDSGLVTERRQGTRRYYRARVEGLAELRAFLEVFLGEDSWIEPREPASSEINLSEAAQPEQPAVT